ncbi:MAG: hypothetical protein WBG90_01590 [Saonia sp.]
MKTVLKFTVAIAMMFSTITALANEPKLYLVANKDAKSLVFQLDAQTKETSIKFIDADNQIIYSDNIKDAYDYTKKFDLSKLNDGEYTFEMEDMLRTITYDITIKKDDMEILKKRENTKPFFRRKGDMLYLNLLNLDHDAIEVKVYDSQNSLILKQALGNGLIIEKAFNFEKAFEDSYTLVLKDNDDTYYQEVIIE